MRSPLRYTKQEKRGITILLLSIGWFQLVLWRYDPGTEHPNSPLMTTDSSVIPAADSLFPKGTLETHEEFRPFNPNFITDYKGYLLGMSSKELDRLYSFRKKGGYVRSAEEFGQVTKISDSILQEIAPYFSFPEKIKHKNIRGRRSGEPGAMRDLNAAREEELQTVRGIGPVLSARIVRFRERLGGFLVDDQLFDVYGLDEEVGRRALKEFRVKEVPVVTKIPLNTARVEELSGLVYLGRKLAERIVAYREDHGRFDSIEQLTKIEDFPSERIGRIKLYLAL